MKKRRAVSFMLALTMIAACVSGCQSGGGESSAASSGGSSAASGSSETASEIPNFNPTGYPICPDETVTIEAMVNANPQMPSDLNDIPLLQEAEEIMNVHVDWNLVPQTGWNEKKSLALATGDLPDVFDSALTTSDLTRYGPDGTLIPMQDLLDEYGVNFARLYEEFPDLKTYITAPDGNIYGVARVNSGPWMTTTGVGVINKDWLDKLGLEMPTTLEEFHQVLQAFKTQDPNGNGQTDEIPFAFAKGTRSPLTENEGITYILNSFGIAISNSDETYADVIDGKVICQATLPEFKEGISYIAQLYQEGLMDMEGFTRTEADMIALLNQETPTVGYLQLWDINDIVSNPDNNAALEYMPLLLHEDGREPVTYRNPMPGVVRGWGCITSACEHPEVVMRWIDYFYEETNSIEHIEGPIGVRLIEGEDGTLTVREPPEGLTVADDRFANCEAQLLAVTPKMYTERLKLPSTDKKVAFVEENVHPYADPDPMQPVYYSAEEATEMSQLQTDIQTYIDQKVSEWMTNGNIDAEWDTYLSELDNMGLQRWLEIKQAAYDRYMAE